jgi:HSP20 family protein
MRKSKMLTITGERKQTEERKKEGYDQTERSYGKFCRNIVLPEGAKPETAKATFTNGVLEIAISVRNRRNRPFVTSRSKTSNI